MKKLIFIVMAMLLLTQSASFADGLSRSDSMDARPGLSQDRLGSDWTFDRASFGNSYQGHDVNTTGLSSNWLTSGSFRSNTLGSSYVDNTSVRPGLSQDEYKSSFSDTHHLGRTYVEHLGGPGLSKGGLPPEHSGN